MIHRSTAARGTTARLLLALGTGLVVGALVGLGLVVAAIVGTLYCPVV